MPGLAGKECLNRTEQGQQSWTTNVYPPGSVRMGGNIVVSRTCMSTGGCLPVSLDLSSISTISSLFIADRVASSGRHL